MSTHTYSFLRARGGGKSQTLHWTGVLGYLLCLGTLVLGCLSTWLPGYLSTFEYRNMCCFLRAKGGGNVLLKYYFHLRAFVQWAEKPRLAGTWLKLSAVVLVLVGWKKVQSRWQWLREETQWLGGSQADHGSPWCNRELLPVQTPQIAFFLGPSRDIFYCCFDFPIGWLDDFKVLKEAFTCVFCSNWYIWNLSKAHSPYCSLRFPLGSLQSCVLCAAQFVYLEALCLTLSLFGKTLHLFPFFFLVSVSNFKLLESK